MGYLRQDDVVTSGFWVVRPEETPGPISLTLPAHRTVYVVEGAVEYAVENGPTYRIGEGDAASFAKGTNVTFTVLAPLRQFFVDHA
jgi:uncharacterized cupin superfamily protein